MKIQAILWDGYNRIQGNLEVLSTTIKFHFLDFNRTDLEFELRYEEIKKVNLHSLFNHGQQGIEILSKSHTINIFIVDDPRELRKSISEKIKTLNPSKINKK